MPWSMVSKVPALFERLKIMGFEREVPLMRVKAELMRVTGVINNRRIAEYIHALETLGYLRRKNDNVVELCVDVNQPYVFNGEEG